MESPLVIFGVIGLYVLLQKGGHFLFPVRILPATVLASIGAGVPMVLYEKIPVKDDGLGVL